MAHGATAPRSAQPARSAGQRAGRSGTVSALRLPLSNKRVHSFYFIVFDRTAPQHSACSQRLASLLYI